MKVTNNSTSRAYHVRDVMIAPGMFAEFTIDVSKDIEGISDLKSSGKAQEVEFTEVANVTAKDLRAILDEKNVKYPSNASKDELQALVDSAK